MFKHQHHMQCDAHNGYIWPSGIGQVSPPIHPLASSQGAVFLINSCQADFSCGLGPNPSYDERARQAIFRSYGCFFAEFLGELSLVRLTLLELTTCVGLRYGFYIYKFRDFSWRSALLHPSSLRLKYYLLFEIIIKDKFPHLTGNFPKSTNANP